MPKRFVDKNVIVTGAARGMGRACVLAFAREGARVAPVDLAAEPLERLAEEIEKAAGRALPLTCNVSVAAEVQQTVDRVVESYGSVDILVNNAGVLRTTTPLEMISETEWDLILDVNLKD